MVAETSYVLIEDNQSVSIANSEGKSVKETSMCFPELKTEVDEHLMHLLVLLELTDITGVMEMLQCNS
ncbi:hypothetical protein V6N11_029384 [Hibiscus sabdariffa]|uniref:Uncharacterized protein n=1 Tax=Hibiscus sabdariffa TaxID=183260 RepID=A0ABR2P6J3_9ROSI